MTQFKDERRHGSTTSVRRIAEVYVTPGVPGTPWSLDRVFAIFTTGEQDLVLTAAPDQATDTRALLGLTREQVAAQFGAVRLPN